MSTALAPADLLDRLAATTGQQRALRVAVVAAAVGFLALVPAAGGELHPWLSGAGVVLALVAAAAPESHAPLGLLLLLGGLWFLAAPDRLGAATVPAAAALLLVHVAATLAAHGPPGVTVPSTLLRTWGVRTAGCAAAAAVLWLTARAAASLHAQAGTATVLALVVVLAWCVLVTARTTGRPRGGGHRGP